MRAGDIMTGRPATIGEYASLADAAELLGAAPDSALHVVDGAGHVVGLLTAAHLLDRVRSVLGAGLLADADATVAEAMSTPILAVDPDTDIRRVAAALADTATYAVAVVDGFAPVGTVTRLELVRALTEPRPDPSSRSAP